MKQLLILTMVILAACSKPPDEQLIRNAIDKMEAAVQKRQTRPVLEQLASDFSGPEGMTTRQVRQLMAAHYFRNKKINVVIAGMRIRINGNNASVTFKAAVTGGSGVLPERLQYYQVETRWLKLDGNWRIVRADWSPAGQV